MESAILSAVAPFTCNECGNVRHIDLSSSNPWMTPNDEHTCIFHQGGGCSKERQISDWIGILIYDTLGLHDVYIKITLRQLTSIVPVHMYGEVHKLVWLTRKCSTSWYVPDFFATLEKIVALLQRTPNVSIDEAYEVMSKCVTTRFYHTCDYNLFQERMEQFNEYKVNPMWLSWYMDAHDFTHISQWMPREMVEDIGILMNRPCEN